MTRKKITWDIFDAINFAQTPKRVKDFAERFNCAEPTARKLLKELVSQRVFMKKGAGRSTRFVSNFHSADDCKKERIDLGLTRKPFGVAIVNHLAKEPMCAHEISEEMSIPIAAIYRILHDLLGLGFIMIWDKRLTQKGKRENTYVATVRYRKNAYLTKLRDRR